MKYFDFIGQSLLIVATMVMAIPLGGTGILIGEFIIGGWQIVSSILSFVGKTPFRKYKNLHLGISIVYVAFFLSFSKTLFRPEHTTLFVIAMMAAWVLAIYYYYITYCWVFSDTKRSRFLPNISF